MYSANTCRIFQTRIKLFRAPLQCLPLLAFVVALLSGCGFGAEPTPTPAPITLRYVTFAGLDAAEQALIDHFRESAPNYALHPRNTAARPRTICPRRQCPI